MKKLFDVLPTIVMIFFFGSLFLFLFRVPIEKGKVFEKISSVVKSIPSHADASPFTPPLCSLAKIERTPLLKKSVSVDSTALNKALGYVSRSRDSIKPHSSYISPKELANKSLVEILRKNKEEAIVAILSDRQIYGRVLEELEIRTAVEAGIQKLPEILEKYGQMLADSMTAKLGNPSLGISDSISLPALGVAVAAIESQGDSTAYCRKTTASGLMQLIFSTARQLCRARGIHFPITDKAMRAFLFHPGMSISLGTDHLRNSAIAFHGDVKKMLTGYECGDAIVLARIKNHKGVDNISYVRKVWPVYCYFLEHYKAPIPTALKQSLVSE